MSDRQKLLFFSIFVLVSVAMSGVGITAFHCFNEAASQDAAGLPVAISWRSVIGSSLITAIVIVAGGTILVRVVNPFIRLLETVKQQLEWKAAELDHFMRALSHDMTANSLLLQSSFEQLQAACQENPVAATRNSLLHMEACLQQSQRFLEDLRELSRTGSVQMESAVVNMQATINEVLFEQSELLEARDIGVTVDPRLPDTWCNPNRVKQVITNLVRNAARHGCARHAPRIKIAAAPALPESPSDLVWFMVQDNGPGIPVAHQQDIFLPGKRLPNADADGTGMGLAIVKKVVEHYGGTIFVKPQAGPSTSFVFGLPVATSEQIIAAAVSPLRRPRRRVSDKTASASHS